MDIGADSYAESILIVYVNPSNDVVVNKTALKKLQVDGLKFSIPSDSS
jgi:hypothetical protein